MKSNVASQFALYFSPQLFTLITEIKEWSKLNKKPALLVGGAVRDLLLGKPVVDADIMVEHPAQSLVDFLVSRTKATAIFHERFLTYGLILPTGVKIDIVTAREELYVAPALLPKVKPSSIEKDFVRRDFTINAMACLLTPDHYGAIVDPLGGQHDLIDKCIRAIHEKSFIDDPTRIYRAARFASRYGFQVARDTESWIQKSLEEEFPALLSPARRRHEFDLILKEDQPEPCLTLLQNWNALRFIHIDWNQLSAKDFLVLNRKPDNSNKISLLTWRWVYWLKNFGSEKATKMMADLAFEKDQKKQIQALL